MLDHHVSGDDLGAEMFKNTEAEATGRLVIDAADQLGVPAVAARSPCRPSWPWPPTPAGSASARPAAETLRLAARLVDAGARPDQTLQGPLRKRHATSRLQLIGRRWPASQNELDGRLIYTWIEQADFAASGAMPSDSEDIINITAFASPERKWP